MLKNKPFVKYITYVITTDDWNGVIKVPWHLDAYWVHYWPFVIVIHQSLELLSFHWRDLSKISNKQTVELLIIWDAITLLLSHCNIWLAVSRSNAMIKLKTKCIVLMHTSIPSLTVKDYSWCGCYRMMESSAGWSKQNEKVLILAYSNDLSYGFLTECGLTIIHTVQQQHYTIYTQGITDFAHENVLWVEYLWV